jgi:hypothetical protein
MFWKCFHTLKQGRVGHVTYRKTRKSASAVSFLVSCLWRDGKSTNNTRLNGECAIAFTVMVFPSPLLPQSNTRPGADRLWSSKLQTGVVEAFVFSFKTALLLSMVRHVGNIRRDDCSKSVLSGPMADDLVQTDDEYKIWSLYSSFISVSNPTTQSKTRRSRVQPLIRRCAYGRMPSASVILIGPRSISVGICKIDSMGHHKTYHKTRTIFDWSLCCRRTLDRILPCQSKFFFNDRRDGLTISMTITLDSNGVKENLVDICSKRGSFFRIRSAPVASPHDAIVRVVWLPDDLQRVGQKIPRLFGSGSLHRIFHSRATCPNSRATAGIVF